MEIRKYLFDTNGLMLCRYSKIPVGKKKYVLTFAMGNGQSAEKEGECKSEPHDSDWLSKVGYHDSDWLSKVGYHDSDWLSMSLSTIDGVFHFHCKPSFILHPLYMLGRGLPTL